MIIKNIKNKILPGFYLVASLLAFPRIAFAQTAAPSETGVDKLKNYLGIVGSKTGLSSSETDDLPSRIAAIVNIALSFLGIIAVIYILYAGFTWMTAAGNEEKVRSAKSTMKNAAIGLLIIFLSFIIVNFVLKQLSGASGGGGGGPSAG